MSDRSERFRARQAVLRDKRAGSGSTPIGDAELVRQHTGSELDQDRLNKERADQQAYYSLETDIVVNDAQVDALLAEIQGKLRNRHIDEILESAMQLVIQNIDDQFGVGRVVTREFADTVEYRRQDYESTEAKKSMRTVRHSSETDAYTGKPMERPEADHITSMKDFHETDGWWLNDDRKRDFAKDVCNLAPVDLPTNRAKGSKPLPDFERQNHERIDGRRTRHSKTRSREAVADHHATPWDKAKFVGREGVSSGVRMGLQQALGVVLQELTVALFEEAKDIYRQGWRASDESFWVVLERRARRILRRVKDKWKDVLSAFGEGLISGFLSLIMEVILKAVKGIARRTGRLIRESIHSLRKAILLLLFPPENMSFSEAAHESTKILSGCVIICMGLAAEQAAEELLRSLMIPYAGLVASVLLGILTGLGAAFVAYGLDKLDIFGAQERAIRKGVFEELAERRGSALEEMDEDLDFFYAPILPNPPR
ncbi:MAG: hypothetical protein OXH50_03350 [Gemmatimonadetes bacterium]|nr:hypothetical protein [Gemmatimonadota bacterium]